MTAPAIASPLDSTDPLAHALHYAGLGWRVAPIAPGTKHPSIDAWQDAATTDADLIAQWWTHWPSHGIGLVTGARSGVWALDVDPAHGGDDTLADLERTHGALPPTVEAITGGGGRHLLFAWPTLPDGVVLTNSAGRLGPGLDSRAEGGQIVVAPTVHPTSGRRYEWELSSRPGEHPIAPAPAWLLELLTAPAEHVPEGQVEGLAGLDTRFAWDAYSSAGNAQALSLLQGAGWHSPRTDRQGVTYLTRPGKAPHAGSSCSIGKVGPGVTYVFTGEADGLEAEHGYRLPDLLTALHFNGDRTAADAWLSSQGWGARTFHSPQERAELAAWVSYQERLGTIATAPAPTVDELDVIDFIREDEPPYDWLVPDLIERGDRLILTGPEGGGKSTLLRQLAVQLASGVHPFGGDPFEPVRVVLVDLENSRRQTRRKLRPLLGIAGARLVEGAMFIAPRPEGIDLAVAEDIEWLGGVMERRRPHLLIIGPIYKMSNGDPTEETTAKPIIRALDTLRERWDCAVLIEAHTPSEYAGKSRLERPYGASIWRRWPEFGIFLDPAGPLRHWRGARDEREWPTALARGAGPQAWPWERATAKDVTFAAMVEVQREATHRLSVRELEQALAERGLGKGAGISKSNVDRAIKANQEQWDALLEGMGL